MLDRIALCGVALFFSMASPAAFTAPSSEPMRLYDEVQSLRQHAGKFSDVEHPTVADLAEAERLLDSAVALIDESKTRELADGNPYLCGGAATMSCAISPPFTRGKARRRQRSMRLKSCRRKAGFRASPTNCAELTLQACATSHVSRRFLPRSI
jgi:hypothetical protein